MILVIFNIADLITTLVALSNGLQEHNPLVHWMICIHPIVFVLAKIAILPLCLWLRDKKSYLFMVGFAAATVWWNIVNIAAIVAAG